MITELTEIFNYSFMVRAMIAGLSVAVIAPMIGIFLILKRYSLLAETLAHLSLIGVAGSLLLGISPLLGAIITSVLAGVGIEELRKNKKIFSESILAIFLSGSLALTLILFSLGSGLGFNVFNYLFGSIVTVSQTELLAIVILAILGVGVVLLFRKKLFLVSYDEEFARANGLETGIYNILLISLASITVALSIKIVGGLLIGALMIIPVVTAIQYGHGFKKTMILSVMFSVISVFWGIYSSFYLNLPASASIVVVLLSLFLLSLVINRFSNKSKTS